MLSLGVLGRCTVYLRISQLVLYVSLETNMMALRVENGENKEGHDVAAVTYASIRVSQTRGKP